MSVSWKKNVFCTDLAKYRLITIFWNSLPMIFKIRQKSRGSS